MELNAEGRSYLRPFAFGDPWPFLLYGSVLLVALVWTIATGGPAAWTARSPWDLVIWVILSAVANTLPIPAAKTISLSMSSPVNVAIAYLFPVPAAVAIVFIASTSEWELKRDTTVPHALFNRTQLALATGLASAAFHLQIDWIPSVVTAALAVLAYQSNLFFVALAETTLRGTSLKATIQRLLPPGWSAAASYLALGSLGVVYGLVFTEIGTWAVVVLLVPLLVLRSALAVSRELERTERDRRILADQLIDERERERTRIASDIHDVVLQELAALQIQADNIVSAIKAGRADAAENIANLTKDGVGRAITDLRGAIANLRRVSLDDEGLIPTLQKYARSFHAKTGIEVAMTADSLEQVDIPLPVGLLMYECCQEALNNVAKHADASRVDVIIKWIGETVELRVRDNGKGMSVSTGNGFGMKLTRDKMSLAGGMMWVENPKGGGTEVVVSLPSGRSL